MENPFRGHRQIMQTRSAAPAGEYTLFSNRNFYAKCNKNEYIHRKSTKKKTNRLIQMIREDKFTANFYYKRYFHRSALSSTYIWRLLFFAMLALKVKTSKNISPLIFQFTYITYTQHNRSSVKILFFSVSLPFHFNLL